MILTFLAMAQPGGGGQGSGGFAAFLPMILIFVIFYFLILRPQAKKQRVHKEMLSALDKGDKVVTTGGIHGTILHVNEQDKTMLVKVSDNTKLTLDTGAISRKIDLSDK